MSLAIPSPPGHIQILISTGKALGLTAEEVLLTPMLPEARALPDFQRTLMVDGQIKNIGSPSSGNTHLVKPVWIGSAR